MEETYNHSMFITSYTNHQMRDRRRRGRDSCGEGGLKVFGLQAQGDAATSAAVSHANAASTDGTVTHSQSPRHSRVVQVSDSVSDSVNLLYIIIMATFIEVNLNYAYIGTYNFYNHAIIIIIIIIIIVCWYIHYT